jgi:hypothetical protein
MAMYISSYYRNIQKEFHHKDERKSRIVRTIDYFDKKSKLSLPKPEKSNSPDIRRVTREIKEMAVSADSRKQSNLLGRSMETPNRISNAPRTSRWSTNPQRRRSRSLLKVPEVDKRKTSLPLSSIAQESSRRQSRRHSINPAFRNNKYLNDSNIKSTKSTEGSNLKVNSVKMTNNCCLRS